MGTSLKSWIEWLTALAAVFSLYAHTAFDLPSSVVTPISAGVIASGLLSLSVLSIPHFRASLGSSRLRVASTICLALALFGFGISTIVGFGQRGMSLNDWGLFGIQIGIPILVWFMGDRTDLIHKILQIAILFAVVDAIANILAWREIIELPSYSARADPFDSTGYRTRYPGFTGNTHAAGLVAMLASCAIACRAYRAHGLVRLLLLGVLALVFVSMELIDARRYLGMAAIGVGLILIPVLWRVPPLATILVISGSALYGAFTNFFDYEDDIRGRLMSDGWSYARQLPFVGQGVFYRDLSDIRPNYVSLSSAGVTESGFLDLALSYGLTATCIFVLGAILAVSARRGIQTVPAVVLTLMTAELAFGDSLTGFLGSVVFYSSLVFVQRDEAKIASPA